MHQSAFIRSLATTNRVVLVAEKIIDERRLRDKWERPDFGTTEIFISPSESIVTSLLSYENAVHIFSGVAAYPFVHRVFKKAIRKNLRIGIVSEPYDWLGWTGILRWLKFGLFSIVFQSRISFILAIGKKGRECFENSGFQKAKIFDWGYFTEENANVEVRSLRLRQNDKMDLIYVGRLSRAKGILDLLNVCASIESHFDTLTIIGQGPLSENVTRFIKERSPNKYRYLGTLTNKDVLKEIANADLMILPSVGKDGWGAVINESLMQGVPVIASDFCGAATLLDGLYRGEQFSVHGKNFLDILKKWLEKGRHDSKHREMISQWAMANITGEVAAKYFIEIVEFVYSGVGSPKAPWLHNN